MDKCLYRRGIDPVSEKPKENFHEYAYVHYRPEDNKDNLSAGYIETLKSMSPAKRKRFYEGEFGAYEGLVYQLNEEVHVVDDFEIPLNWERARAIDFGYVHNFVCLWSAKDPSNETIYFYREWVKSKMTVRSHSIEIKALSIHDLPDNKRHGGDAWKEAERRYKFTVADHDAEDRATLEENGIMTEAANKDVLQGLDNCIEMLHDDPSIPKKTKIKIFRSCTGLLNGLYSYRWKEADGGRAKKDREVVKEDDDEADAFRYAVQAWFPVSDESPQVYVPKRKETPGARIRKAGISRRLQRFGIR